MGILFDFFAFIWRVFPCVVENCVHISGDPVYCHGSSHFPLWMRIIKNMSPSRICSLSLLFCTLYFIHKKHQEDSEMEEMEEYERQEQDARQMSKGHQSSPKNANGIENNHPVKSVSAESDWIGNIFKSQVGIPQSKTKTVPPNPRGIAQKMQDAIKANEAWGNAAKAGSEEDWNTSMWGQTHPSKLEESKMARRGSSQISLAQDPAIVGMSPSHYQDPAIVSMSGQRSTLNANAPSFQSKLNANAPTFEPMAAKASKGARGNGGKGLMGDIPMGPGLPPGKGAMLQAMIGKGLIEPSQAFAFLAAKGLSPAMINATMQGYPEQQYMAQMAMQQGYSPQFAGPGFIPPPPPNKPSEQNLSRRAAKREKKGKKKAAEAAKQPQRAFNQQSMSSLVDYSYGDEEMPEWGADAVGSMGEFDFGASNAMAEKAFAADGVTRKLSSAEPEDFDFAASAAMGEAARDEWNFDHAEAKEVEAAFDFMSKENAFDFTSSGMFAFDESEDTFPAGSSRLDLIRRESQLDQEARWTKDARGSDVTTSATLVEDEEEKGGPKVPAVENVNIADLISLPDVPVQS
jgi:hypothetical protein